MPIMSLKCVASKCAFQYSHALPLSNILDTRPVPFMLASFAYYKHVKCMPWEPFDIEAVQQALQDKHYVARAKQHIFSIGDRYVSFLQQGSISFTSNHSVNSEKLIALLVQAGVCYISDGTNIVSFYYSPAEPAFLCFSVARRTNTLNASCTFSSFDCLLKYVTKLCPGFDSHVCTFYKMYTVSKKTFCNALYTSSKDSSTSTCVTKTPPSFPPRITSYLGAQLEKMTKPKIVPVKRGSLNKRSSSHLNEDSNIEISHAKKQKTFHVDRQNSPAGPPCHTAGRTLHPQGGAKREKYVKHKATALLKLVNKFHTCVAEGPVHKCICCSQLWYKEGVLPATKLEKKNYAFRICINEEITKDKSVCLTCFRFLNNKKIPPCAIANGNAFPPCPPDIQLRKLEWRLLSLRIAFLKIFQASRGKQFKVINNVVNVPANVSTTVTHLPRCQNDLHTLKVQLKRTIGAVHPYMSETIRPSRVMRVAKWLFTHGPLYREEHVQFDRDWNASLIPDEYIDENPLVCSTFDTVPDECDCIMHLCLLPVMPAQPDPEGAFTDEDGQHADAFYVIMNSVYEYAPVLCVDTVRRIILNNGNLKLHPGESKTVRFCYSFKQHASRQTLRKQQQRFALKLSARQFTQRKRKHGRHAKRLARRHDNNLRNHIHTSKTPKLSDTSSVDVPLTSPPPASNCPTPRTASIEPSVNIGILSRPGRSAACTKCHKRSHESLPRRIQAVSQIKQRNSDIVARLKRRYKRLLSHTRKRFVFSHYRIGRKIVHLYRHLIRSNITLGKQKLSAISSINRNASEPSAPKFLVDNAFAKAYVCMLASCGFVAHSLIDISAHMQDVHDAAEEHSAEHSLFYFRCTHQPKIEIGNIYYVCSECFVRYEYEHELTEHMLQHHGVAPWFSLQSIDSSHISQGVRTFSLLDTDDVILAYVLRTNEPFHTLTTARIVVGIPSFLRSFSPFEQLYMQGTVTNGKSTTQTLQDFDEEKDDNNFYLRVHDETVERSVPGVTDTLLTGKDFLEPDERHKVFNIAPGEGMSPLSIFSDTNCEEKAFPEIWLGHKRLTNFERLRFITYIQQCKSELRRSDRRVAQNIDNIFFKVKKLQMKILLSSPRLAIRKVKPGAHTLTAGNAKNPAFVNSLVRHDEGYTFLKALRGSPPYFEQAKKDLFAMIRQLGPATFFCSFSSAETKWKHLIRMLAKLNDGIDCSDDEIAHMSWENICRLIRSDPVTCARHFDYQLRQFIHKFLLSKHAPIGIIQDWFYRVEMQSRGSCHVHFIIWIVDAPQFGKSDNKDLIRFIDENVSCAKPQENTELASLVGRQIHRHSKACQTRRGACRFHYPQPPMLKTCILEPLGTANTEHYRRLWKQIYKYLNDLKLEHTFTFDDMLQTFNISHDEYILAVRASINASTIFLKRKLSEIRVNNYNKYCLLAWRANMDIQFIMDIYQCAMYVVSYVSKAQRGISELLANATKEAKEGNFTLQETFRHIGNCFTNGVEISAQEAVYILLGMSMRQCSRKVVFINTSPPDERVRLLKSSHEIEQMDDNDEDVLSSNLLTRYSKRPKYHSDVCLADWTAYYDGIKKGLFRQKRAERNAIDHDSFPPEEDLPENNDDVPFEERIVNKETARLARRHIPRIIRPVWFNVRTNAEKCYRELLMLFHPWRNEEKDLLAEYATFQEHYEATKEQIDNALQLYSPNHAIFQQVLDNLGTIDMENETMFQFAPNIQQTDLDDNTTNNERVSNTPAGEYYDIGEDLGIPTNIFREDEFVRNKEVADDVFRSMVRCLNIEQREIFDHILHAVKTKQSQQCIFVTGGAGVGKTFLIETIYQALTKHYDHLPGSDFTQTKILLIAPTGKAAYNISGNTIHTALALSGRDGGQIKDLNIDTLTKLSNKLGSIEFVIIDEISMVGRRLFKHVNERLQQLKRSNRPFGGVHMLAVGDLYQLQPVGDSWIFKSEGTGLYDSLLPSIWLDNFKCFELHTIMRQKDDTFFAELLNRLRTGEQTQEDIAVLKTRIIKTTDPHYSLDIPHGFFMVIPKDKFNALALNGIHGETHRFVADDSVIGGHSYDFQREVLAHLPQNKNLTMQLTKILETKVNHKMEMVLNIDTNDGLVNGAPCTVMHVQYSNTNVRKPTIIWVKFDKDATGAQTRRSGVRLYKPDIHKSWTPVLPVSRRFSVLTHKGVQVQRRQFPLTPAHGRTIHKLQGGTLDSLVCSILANKRKPPEHIHYVAFSRVTKLQNLHLLDFDPDDIRVDKRVHAEMQRFHTSAMLVTAESNFYKNTNDRFKILYQNATSLRKHISDVRSDYNVNSADLCFFTESRIMPGDPETSYMLDNFTSYVFPGALVTNQQRSSYGTVMYTRHNFAPCFPYTRSNGGIEITVAKLLVRPADIFIGVYRSPTASLSLCLEMLQDILATFEDIQNIMILGDFNVDIASNGLSVNLQSFCKNNHFSQLISQPTTNSLTTIDHIYTNVQPDLVTCGTFENYYSYHKAIWATLAK